MTLKHLNPPQLLTFDAVSQVVIAPKGATIHIAGQSAYDAQFNLIGGNSYRAQSLQALRHLKAAVEAAGGSVTQIVSSTVYLKHLTPEASQEFFAALATALDGQPFPPHALTVVGVTALSGPEALVEISATAVLPD